MKRVWLWGLAALLAAALAGGVYNRSQTAASLPSATVETRRLTYLGQEYNLPAPTQKFVVTGALEALEDLLALGVKPAGMMTIGGAFPPLFAAITQDAKPIGERMQPSFEAMLQIRPDVIISSDKFPAATTAQMRKIAPVIPISHYPADGEANLRFLGELTGTQDKVEAILADYRQSVAAAKQRLPQAVRDKQAVAIRFRAGGIAVYPANVFFNEILYAEMGLQAPAEIKAVKAQEAISLERFSAMDPDYIFLQYADSENPGQSDALAELQRNPIWQSMKAVRNKQVFINVVDPLIQGVAVSGKLQFLHAAVEKLSQ